LVAVAIRSPSSSGLGRRPFKAAARVRTPLGTQDQTALTRSNASCSRGRSRVQHELGSGRGAELPPKRHTSSSAHPLRVPLLAFAQGFSAAAAGRAAPTCSSSNPEPAGRCPAKCGLLEADAAAAFGLFNPLSRGRRRTLTLGGCPYVL